MGHPCLAALLALALSAVVDDDLARELPRIPATEAKDAPKTLRIVDGYRAEPVAAEPLLTDPVAAAYDADGRLYVVEMRGYPYTENVPPGNVRILTDDDGDGHFDRSAIFLDDLSWPTAIVPHDGGVFIAVAPDILYAKDTDGDGKADVRKVVFTGFGRQNVQALLNNLTWGPDGWIYGASGPNGGEIKAPAHPEKPAVSVRGRDFRFKADGSAFEAVSGGGQFGHAFDDWGHRFACDNSHQIRQIVLPADAMARNPDYAPPSPIVDIAADGPAGPVFRISPPEPWRVVRTRQRVADPEFVKKSTEAEKFAAGFFTSATGVTIYRGTAYPPEDRGNAFIGDVGGNLVHRKRMTPDGVPYKATRRDEGREFLASTDNWFRPVNFANTPSGTLLVLDMYRETIEHPASIPEPIKKHLDLTSGHDRGRLYEILPDGFRRRPAPKLTKATTAELVATLADPDAWWRETAQRLLIERADPAAIPLLKALATGSPSTLGRAHALRSLDAFGGLDAPTLLPAFNDVEPRLREQAATLARKLPANPTLRGPLLALANDPDSLVRFEAAISLGDLPGDASTTALTTIARKDLGDRWIRAAVLSGLKGRSAPFLVRLFAGDGEAAPLDTPAGRAWLDDLAGLVATDGDGAGVDALLDLAFADARSPGQVRALLVGLDRGLRRRNQRLGDVLRGERAERLDRRLRAAVGEAGNADLAESVRLDAVALLGLAPKATALEALLPLIDPRQPVALQMAALRGLDPQTDPAAAAAAAEVAGRWPSLGPAARGEAIEWLMRRPERRAALLDAVAGGRIAPGDLDPARRAQLRNDADAALKAQAEKLFAPDDRGERARVVEAYREATTLAGDPAKGRAGYQKACATCHRAEGKGTNVGPDLETVAARTAEDLVIHILDPNREVAPNFVNYAVETTDGRVLTGLLADESTNAITLKRGEGVTESLPRSQVEAIKSTGTSLMPEGLEKELRPADLADLIAFLKGLGGSAPPK